MSNYQHTQIGHAIIYPLATLGSILLAVSIFSHSSDTAAGGSVCLLAVVLCYKLTISIDDEKLRASFGLGLIRKQVPLDQIVACEPFRIRPWEGWGIHLSRHGWLYNVSGWDAVALRLRNGRELALGTDDPAGLVRALEQRGARLTLS